MTRMFSLMALWGCCLTPMAAWGQAPAGMGPSLEAQRGPTVTPYLDLVPGIQQNLGFQYYRRLLPERRFRANERAMRQSLSGLRRDLQTQRDLQEQERLIQTQRSGLTPTGNPSGFLTHDRYFNVNQFGR